LTFDNALVSIKLLISEEFKRHKYLLETDVLNEFEKEKFFDIIRLKANTSFYEKSLKDLSTYLLRYYHQKPILLIDEYDTPIHTAYSEGYYREMIAFMRSFLGAGLKDNTNIYKGVLTGILRVAKESIFSGMNNLGVYTLLQTEFSDKFGLTEKEVEQLLNDYQIEEKYDAIKRWYNGYIFGDTVIYNPWSILNYVSSKDKRLRNYWANTSSNEIIKDLIANSTEMVKAELQDLLQDIPIRRRLNENIVFDDLTRNEITIYSFLVFSGYLKAFAPVDVDEIPHYNLLIPNREVKQVFKDVIMSWITYSYENHRLQMMLNALIRNEIKVFEEILSDFVLETLSYFDTQRRSVEGVYQAFILGLLVNLSPRYEINSNKESGYGRYDISIIPKDKNKPAIIMELKKISFDEDKDSALANALNQIEEKKYEADIRKKGIKEITKLAVTFDGKRVWVKEG
jgi:hypothetical protein